MENTGRFVGLKMMTDDTFTAKFREIARRLSEKYRQIAPERGHCAALPAVDELILTLLSQSTTDINSWRGYQALLARYNNWDALADAPVPEIIACIRCCGLAVQKAPRMKAILQRIRAEHGEISLDFLRDEPVEAALEYLLSFKGVGRKTASCILLFSLGKAVMPVDTHVLRVAKRLALVPENCNAERAHALLEEIVPESEYLSFHLNVIAHGRQICRARNPQCGQCPLADICSSNGLFGLSNYSGG